MVNFTHDPMTSVMTLISLWSYGGFVSQLIRHARVCSKYNDFLFRGSIPF